MKALLFLQVAVGTDTTSQAGEAGINQSTSEFPIWDIVKMGEWYIMIPLALMSVVAVYILVERLLAISKASKGEKNFMPKVKEYLQDGKIDAAKNLCGTTNNPAARMVEKGISRIGKPMKDIASSIENTGKLEINLLEKRISVLATIAGSAPMIGFLGTTIGMMRSFHELQFKSTIELKVIAPGIMQAMVTTVAGLIVGILAYMAYNFLVSRIGKVINDMEAASIEFLDVLQEPGNK